MTNKNHTTISTGRCTAVLIPQCGDGVPMIFPVESLDVQIKTEPQLALPGYRKLSWLT